ncbi:MAG: hypothetical protein FJ147_04780 [Deltaproteobacteria bacterium]|nr:hypothetical protein [Deltaproteobacteria bacterium]
MNRLLVGFILVLIGVAAVFSHTAGQRLYYVKGSQFVFPPHLRMQKTGGWDPQECQQLLRESHQLTKGGKLVLIVRKWDRLSMWRDDDDTYETLSIAIDHPEFDSPIQIGGLNVQLRYSAGRIHGVDRCEGIFSTTGNGYLVLSKGPAGLLTAKLDVNVQPQDVGTFAVRDTIAIRTSVTFESVSLEFVQAGLG